MTSRLARVCRYALALRPELECSPLAEIQEFERVSGDRVVDLEPQTFEHGQTGRRVIGIDVEVESTKARS